MTESLILCLLDELLPKELTRFIVMLYLRPFKAGQPLFKCSCGQISKVATGWILNKFGIFDTFIKEKYICSSSDYYKLIELKEGEEEDELLKCAKCGKRWIKTCEDNEGTGQKFQCFCRKITEKFPCGTCTAKKCEFEECNRVAKCVFVEYEGVIVLCKKHYQCKICKNSYLYWVNTPDFYGFPGCIYRECITCEKSKEYEFTEAKYELFL